VKQEIFLGEINKLDKIDLVVLSCFGHVGIDYVGNLFDNNKQVIRFPPLSFFRYLKIYKNKGIKIDDSIQINKLTDIIINNFLKKSLLKSYNFFQNNSQKKQFKLFFKKFMHNSNTINFEKKIFLGIHYGLSKIYKIKILNKKYIFTQEDRANYCHLYKKYFKTKYIFVIRDPRAAFAGSYNVHKFWNLNKTYSFDRLLGNWLIADQFLKKNKNSKVYILKNEKFQGILKLKKEMTKLSKWLNIKYSDELIKPTFFGKIWHGDSSYLGWGEKKKALPKNFYNIKNVTKRWKSKLNDEQILDIEMLLFHSMKKHGYRLENNVTALNLIKAYYRILFSYKEKYNFFKNIYHTIKNVIRRILILINPLFATKFVDLN
jgi:hypothetical protein